MRKLKTTDAIAFCRCIKRVGLKERIREITANADNVKDVVDQGFEILWSVMEAATEPEGETAIYEFLSGPFEMTPKQVGNLDLDVMISNLKQLATENNLAGFFKSAADSMTK